MAPHMRLNGLVGRDHICDHSSRCALPGLRLGFHFARPCFDVLIFDSENVNECLLPVSNCVEGKTPSGVGVFAKGR